MLVLADSHAVQGQLAALLGDGDRCEVRGPAAYVHDEDEAAGVQAI
jgi:hypothetical protein